MLCFVLFVQVSLPAAQDDLVIDIGNIHNEFDMETKIVSQYAPNDICCDIISCMTQVGIIINGRTACIP